MFCPRWFPKMLTGMHKMHRTIWAVTFLEQYHKDGNFSITSHCTSNRSWNLGLIFECWNQRAVKAVDAHTFTHHAREMMATLFWDRTRWWNAGNNGVVKY
jgi:hypothetical protein